MKAAPFPFTLTARRLRPSPSPGPPRPLPAPNHQNPTARSSQQRLTAAPPTIPRTPRVQAHAYPLGLPCYPTGSKLTPPCPPATATCALSNFLDLSRTEDVFGGPLYAYAQLASSLKVAPAAMVLEETATAPSGGCAGLRRAPGRDEPPPPAPPGGPDNPPCREPHRSPRPRAPSRRLAVIAPPAPARPPARPAATASSRAFTSSMPSASPGRAAGTRCPPAPRVPSPAPVCDGGAPRAR